MSESGESDDLEIQSENSSDYVSGAATAILKATDSVLNLDLWRAADETNEEVSWLTVSFIFYYAGFIGLVLWIVYVSLISGIDYISSSGGIISGGLKVLSVVPFAPVAAFLAVVSIRGLLKKIENRVQTDDSPAETKRSKWGLLFISIAALVAAIVVRIALYRTARSVLGNSPYTPRLLGLMLVDIIYISLMLIGLGGLGSAYFLKK